MRHLATMAADIAAVVLLSGSSAGETGAAPAPTAKTEASATPASESAFEVEAAVKNADPARYSAEIRTETYTGSILGVRFEQWLEMAGKSARNVVTFKNFGAPVPVSAPE
ncbi:hypothetical protein ACF05L_13020 [Streptomyces bobili]|uniref:hypothetical protein n=1 Tax=Streptomyces bobili TaxID=67280 RepID=UPI0036FAF9C0